MNQPVAVVTGAAGELGATILARLLRDGYQIAAMERADPIAASIPDRFPGEPVTSFAADQTDPDAVAAVFDRIVDEVGVPSVVVANAGYAKFGSLLDIPVKTFSRHVGVNLVGTFAVCQAAARAMAAGGNGGTLVVISSNLALAHADQVAAYCVTKAALLPLVRSLAAELGVYDIRVNALLPGVVETAMTATMLDRPGVRADLIEETPLGRLGIPGDIANAVSFLASDQATWITGAALTADGGQSIYGQPRWIRQDRSVRHQPRWEPALGDKTNRILVEDS